MIRKNQWFKKFFPEEEAGATSAPAPQPAESSAVEDTSSTEGNEGDSAADWGDLSSDQGDDGDFEAGLEPQAEEAAVVAEAEKAPETAAEAASAEETQPQQQAPDSPQPFTPEQVAAAESAYKTQLQTLYAFDEETALQLQTEPEKVLPQLAARLHMDVMKAVMGQMKGLMPEMIQRHTQVARKEGQAQDLFFKAWPELKGYDKQIMQAGRLFREMNPNADANTAVERIGALAMAALGMQRAAPAQDQQIRPAPFTPAVPGRVSAPVAQKNMWADLAEDDD